MGSHLQNYYHITDPVLLCAHGCEWYAIGDGVCNPQANLDNEDLDHEDLDHEDLDHED